MDPEAPIIYGQARTLQQAEVYDPRIQKLADTNDEFSATVLSEGKPRDIDFRISTTKTSNGLAVNISAPPDTIIGISEIYASLSADQSNKLFEQLKSEKASVYVSFLEKFSGSEANRSLEYLFSPVELQMLAKQPMLFVAGEKSHFGIEASNLATTTADLIVFDKSHNPIFAAKANVLVPSK